MGMCGVRGDREGRPAICVTADAIEGVSDAMVENDGAPTA